MPKLDQDKKDGRMRLVEEAALNLFKERGFSGVGLREIAAAAGVSLGNIYNYYRGKEAIFESLLARLYEEFRGAGQPLFRYIRQSRFPEDLPDFGLAVGKMVEHHADYLKLIYIDITEFGGRHVRSQYVILKDTFAALLKERFAEIQKEKTFPGGIDPAVAFTVVYMQFFNYFIVERQIGARGHLSLTDTKAVRMISRIFQQGLGGK